jgi:hypothetical protein
MGWHWLTTATVAGESLKSLIGQWLQMMPAFPGAVMNIAAVSTAKEKGPGSRLVKCNCPDCGYTIRTTAKWLAIGLPTCPCGEEMVQA